VLTDALWYGDRQPRYAYPPQAGESPVSAVLFFPVAQRVC